MDSDDEERVSGILADAGGVGIRWFLGVGVRIGIDFELVETRLAV